MSCLPDDLKDQTQALMRVAIRLPAREGVANLEKQGEWPEREYPSAAASLREGLEEMFTVRRLQISLSLARCWVTPNVIESPHSGVRLRTRRGCRRYGQRVLRRGGGRAARNREELSQNYGLPGSVDAENGARPKHRFS
jgi:hypothetical protein